VKSLNVHLVKNNVSLVKDLPKFVFLVPKIMVQFQNAQWSHNTPNLLKLLIFQLVLLLLLLVKPNVLNVLLPQDIVKLVKSTEKTHQPVHVFTDTMLMKVITCVKSVHFNVKLVIPQDVSNVLETESIYLIVNVQKVL
jgi:hypothetical protein